MDIVFEYELVLPNATFATVNELTHPDLYFALRGGMNNFGIITHFTMRAVQQGKMLAGMRTYTADKRDAIIEQAHQLTTKWENDTAMAFYYSFGYNQTADEYTLVFHQEYSLPTLSPAPFEELNRIPFETSTIRIDWNSEFSIEGASRTPLGDLDGQLQDIMAEELQSIKHATSFFPNLAIGPLYEAAIRAGKERGGNAAGIDADGPLSVALLTVRWENAEDDDRMAAFAGRWTERPVAVTTEAGKHHPWLYINYASKAQDPFRGYGEANLQRLEVIQARVDPPGFFTSRGLCRGYWLLAQWTGMMAV
ncbi:hypothetical protein BBP40_006945 [Aspergillus hancockii]|nr:hypothetical protein BBP40_006945 [Aspergillus hancockii]